MCLLVYFLTYSFAAICSVCSDAMIVPEIDCLSRPRASESSTRVVLTHIVCSTHLTPSIQTRHSYTSLVTGKLVLW